MSLPIRIETITLGDELLLGIRENAHLSYLGIQLAHHGIEPSANLVVRDQADEIKTFFSESWKRSDLVITTGGLGPTSDDLTRETIAEILDEELVFDPSIENDPEYQQLTSDVQRVQYQKFVEHSHKLFTDEYESQLTAAIFFRSILASNRYDPLDSVLEKGIASRIIFLLKTS